MRPIEEFVYVGNQVIVPDQASLMRCYYPIIGSEGYALYQYFVAFYDNGNHRHKFAAILNHLNFGMQPLQESLAVSDSGRSLGLLPLTSRVLCYRA